jgi:hypothetical protein
MDTVGTTSIGQKIILTGIIRADGNFHQITVDIIELAPNCLEIIYLLEENRSEENR